MFKDIGTAIESVDAAVITLVCMFAIASNHGFFDKQPAQEQAALAAVVAVPTDISSSYPPPAWTQYSR